MGITWKNEFHLEKWLTLGKIRITWKHGSHLEKYAKLETIGPTWEKGVYTCRNGSHLKKSGSHLENETHFQKWVTLGKMDHT